MSLEVFCHHTHPHLPHSTAEWTAQVQGDTRQVLCSSTHHLPHPSHTDTSLERQYSPFKLCPCLCARLGTSWKPQASFCVNFQPRFLISSLAVSLWHFTCKCQKVLIRNEKNASTCDSLHLGLAPFFSWSFFLSFSMELKPMFLFPENWSSHLRDSQWDHSGNISSWRSLLGDF